MLKPPQKIGKYEIRGSLGRGAMGVVLEAWDNVSARRVALKTVRRDQLEGSEAAERLQRFQREAQAAGRLSHPNIVSVYEYGEEDGTAFIAMEYVDGRNLKDYFDENKHFSLPLVGHIMAQLLDALAHAHAKGVVHRDVKPGNLFFLDNGDIKVGDFGIARIESSNLTQIGCVLGTPAYMSPEQFMGQTADSRSDLFAAGVILYQFLSGEKPFAGTLSKIMQKVLKEDPVPPSVLNPKTHPIFDAVIRKALAKRPGERFQNAKEFSAALLAAMAEAVVVTSVGAPPAPRPSHDKALHNGAQTPPQAPAPINRWRGLAFAIVAGLFVTGLGAALYRIKYPRSPTAAHHSEIPSFETQTATSTQSAHSDATVCA